MKPLAAGFSRALSVVLGTAFVAVGAVALLGLAPRPDIYKTGLILVVVLAAVLLPWPKDNSWRGGAAIGIVAGIAGVVGYGLLSDGPAIGPGQVGALLGALVTFPLLRLAGSGGLGPRFVRFALLILLVVVGIAFVRTILGGGAFGHDESAYVLKARSWVEGTPDTGWSLHRGPFVSWLAVAVVAFTESEAAVRLVGSLLSVAALAGVMLVARRMGGLWAALIAGATVGASLPYLRRGAEYLTDVPAAGVLLCIVAVVLAGVHNPERGRRLVIWLGPLVALGFYVRYQSALSMIGIALATVVVWPRVVKRLRRPLLMAGAIAFTLLLPHFIWATVITGRPWGVVLLTEEVSGRAFVGEGLADYAGMFPKDLAGPAGALLMVVAMLWVVWSLIVGARQRSEDARLSGFVTIVVIVAVVPLGLVAHGEPRFVFFPVWLLIALGAHVLVGVARRLTPRQLVTLVAVAAIGWIFLFTETVNRTDRQAEARAAGFQTVVDASEYIELASSGTCGVLTSYLPQVTWYSKCFTDGFSNESAEASIDRLEGDKRYVLLFENGKRQPAPDRVQDFLELGPVSEIYSSNESIGDATIVAVPGDTEP
ncbi:MAG: glycosyltransferase family 39 protein [Acidimicrobiia bacterium]